MVAVELSLKQLMDAIKQLSPSEKLELNQMIWSEDITIPDEHIKFVEDRRARANFDPGLMLDWDVVSKKLKQ